MAVQKWIQDFWIDFKGIVIIQNCASNKRYLIREPCNLAHIESIETTFLHPYTGFLPHSPIEFDNYVMES
jgi:hypothetical protein